MNAGERLVTVLVTLAVPEQADPDDAAALLVVAAESTSLRVVHAAAVEGHVPLPGSTVMRGRQQRPWLVLSIRNNRAVLRDLAGGAVEVGFVTLSPDLVVADAVSDSGG